MAEHLASIFGTEKDRVNCPFYFKTGACCHGDRCSRLHNRPTNSPTLLLSNMYQRPDMITPGIDAQGNPIDPHKLQEHFEDFYEDIFEELSKYGEIERLNVCDNLADHMIGNVYIQFRDERQAAAAMRGLQGRLYSGRPIIIDFSPVTDFCEATCGRFRVNRCNKGADCCYIHVKEISPFLRKKLYGRSGRSWYGRSQSWSSSYRRDRESRERSDERGDHRRSSERDIESERRTRSKGRSRSLRYRRDRESRERSHERGDHRRNSERWTRSEGRSRSRSRSRSLRYRRDRESRERSHERGDHRRNSERWTRSEGRSRSRSRSRSPSYIRDRESRERSHERGDHRGNSERNIGKGMEAKDGRGEEW